MHVWSYGTTNCVVRPSQKTTWHPSYLMTISHKNSRAAGLPEHDAGDAWVGVLRLVEHDHVVRPTQARPRELKKLEIPCITVNIVVAGEGVNITVFLSFKTLRARAGRPNTR